MKKLESLINAYNNSPLPSYKVTNNFPIYADLFSHLIDTNCTFIETGVLNGGSLFMWRSWLGDKARIIGIDLNPAAKKWEEHGFEIYIGDQGDTDFWKKILPVIGQFDVLLDDGGHQSFQQIITLTEAIKYGKSESLIVIEDPIKSNQNIIDLYENIYSIQFYTGMVAFKINSKLNIKPELVLNKKTTQAEPDYRYEGKNSATILWPDPFEVCNVVVKGKD